MPFAHFGHKNEAGFELVESPDLIAVRTRSGRSITRSRGPVAEAAAAEVNDGHLVLAFPEAGVEVYRVPVTAGRHSLETRKSLLRESADVRFAGGVLVDPVSDEPVLYTENIFIKFVDGVDADDARTVLRDAGLQIKSELPYAGNAWFVTAPEGTGQRIFEIANSLLQRNDVEYCHPELVRRRASKGIYPQQWHLARTKVGGVVIDAHANVELAHQISQGAGTTIAIIDDGVDIEHPEFSGAGKIVAPRDATLQTDDPRPKDPDAPQYHDDHGTACAGVACANGAFGASGVAPKARLMPIRLSSALGSQREADAFVWAADHGADVISCSWGPPDGNWSDPADPRHSRRSPLPASTRLAIDYVTSQGRAGKGCVVLFAAGNGNESVDLDGYASYPKVMAVAACNDRGLRSVYSDYGDALWCAFPSNDRGHQPFAHPNPLTPGIWTTDRRADAGYNRGHAGAGDVAGNYTASFGGTSSACPGAAGVAALILSVNPALKWFEVKDIMRRACDRIDPAGGNYDAAGRSRKYGHGRLNARTAVDIAKPAPRSALAISRTFDAPILDLRTVSFELEVSEEQPVAALAVKVKLKHGYLGDLMILLLPPPALNLGAITLHQHAGGSRKNLDQTYDAATTPALANLAGRSCKGVWTLQITDAAAKDTGVLESFGLLLSMVHN